MKYAAIRLLRAARCLRLADAAVYAARRLSAAGRNRRFRRENPDFPTPPAGLAFDAYNTVDWEWYRESGRRHARMFAELAGLAPAGAPAERPIRILEWGCGPGRIVRHLAEAMAGLRVEIWGSDVSGPSIAWCRDHLPGIGFLVHGPGPPLPAPDGGFDVVISYSVFTHLSEASQMRWAVELHRVLRPGGVLVATTHGEAHRPLLGPKERAAYDAGKPVIQGGYREGRKWFLAVHPPAYVRERLLSGFTGVRHLSSPADFDETQDVWIAQRPLDSGGGLPSAWR